MHNPKTVLHFIHMVHPRKRLEGTRLHTITMLWICIYLLSLDPDSGQGQSKGPRKAAVPVIAYRPFI